jgi:hypothetical protein
MCKAASARHVVAKYGREVIDRVRLDCACRADST